MGKGDLAEGRRKSFENRKLPICRGSSKIGGLGNCMLLMSYLT